VTYSDLLFFLTGPISLLRGVYQLSPAVTLQITDVYQLRPRLLRVSVLAASRGQFSGITFVYQAADKPNSFTVESGQGYLGFMSVFGAANWVKLRRIHT
jgi:hypothetical protein